MDNTTYLWQEHPRELSWRIQTRDKNVIKKLIRRNNVMIIGYGINDSIMIFRTQYKSRKNARKSLERLTGQKVYKDSKDDVFFAKSGCILHDFNKYESL